MIVNSNSQIANMQKNQIERAKKMGVITSVDATNQFNMLDANDPYDRQNQRNYMLNNALQSYNSRRSDLEDG